MQAESLTAPIGPSKAPSTSNPASWLISKKADALAILVAGPLISLLLLVAIMQGPAFLIGALLFALFLDLPHVLHTQVRIFANPADYQRVRVHFWVSLALISVVCVGLAAVNEFAALVAIWVYWQPYHVCKQHYGVATMYARKAGYQRSTNHVLFLVLAGFAAPLLYRMSSGGFQFGDYVLFGSQLPFSGLKIPTPPVATPVVAAAYALFLVAIANYAIREWAGARRGSSMPRFVWVMLAISLALYNVAYLFVGDLYALILIGTSIHAFQYHLVCASSVRQVLPQATTPPGMPGFVHTAHAWVKKYGTTRMVWVALLAVSLVVLITEIPTLGIVPLILVLHHFYLDGVIWKRKKPR